MPFSQLVVQNCFPIFFNDEKSSTQLKQKIKPPPNSEGSPRSSWAASWLKSGPGCSPLPRHVARTWAHSPWSSWAHGGFWFLKKKGGLGDRPGDSVQFDPIAKLVNPQTANQPQFVSTKLGDNKDNCGNKLEHSRPSRSAVANVSMIGGNPTLNRCYDPLAHQIQGSFHHLETWDPSKNSSFNLNIKVKKPKYSSFQRKENRQIIWNTHKHTEEEGGEEEKTTCFACSKTLITCTASSALAVRRLTPATFPKVLAAPMASRLAMGQPQLGAFDSL